MSHQAQVKALIDRTGADSVYMLLHPGWAKEARANRWHMAVRWARHLPVTLVVPEKTLWTPAVSRERRIPNVRILRVFPNIGGLWGVSAQLQTGSILADLRRTGARKPILWAYNAGLLEAFAALPAVARVHHVTENYFDFGTIPADSLDRIKRMSRLADLNVAVSDGCAEPLRPDVEPHRLTVATNGCDFPAYGAAVAPDPQVQALRGQFDRIAVFGGNINDRIEFDLSRRAAEANPRTVLVFVGAVALTPGPAAKFRALLGMSNVKHFGPVDPDRLPAIYRAADVGFVPYTRIPMITRNGFPLKVLEMAATGLPVVTTYMQPLMSLVPPLAVTEDAESFLAAFASAHRTPSLETELRALAARNDYDARFGDIAAQLTSVERRPGPRFDALPAPIAGTPEAIQETLIRQRWSAPMLYWRFRVLVLGRMAIFVDRLPDPVRDRVVRFKRTFIAPSKVTG